MQIKVTVRYHLTSIRMAIIKTEDSNLGGCWLEPLCIADESIKIVHQFWKTVWQFLKKLNIELSGTFLVVCDFNAAHSLQVQVQSLGRELRP